MNGQVMERLEINENKELNILDAGCGIGTTCVQMAKKKPNTFFTGINISQKQIEFGKKLIDKNNLNKKIKLIQADFTKTSFEDAAFDGAYAIESACYARGFDKKDFIKEMARIIKKDGRLVVADGFIKNKNTMPGWVEKSHKKNMNYWAIEESADIYLFILQLKNTGFKIIEIKDISWNVAPSAIYLPISAFKVLIKKIRNGGTPSPELNSFRINYIKAAMLTFFLGFFRKYFRYYLITAKRVY